MSDDILRICYYVYAILVRSHWFVKQVTSMTILICVSVYDTYSEMLTISMSSTMSSTLNLHLRRTQIGIWCSGTKKRSQNHQINHFCHTYRNACRNAYQTTCRNTSRNTSRNMFEVAVSKSDTKLQCWSHCGSNASPSPTWNPTLNLPIKL